MHWEDQKINAYPTLENGILVSDIGLKSYLKLFGGGGVSGVATCATLPFYQDSIGSGLTASAVSILLPTFLSFGPVVNSWISEDSHDTPNVTPKTTKRLMKTYAIGLIFGAAATGLILYGGENEADKVSNYINTPDQEYTTMQSTTLDQPA